MYKSKPVILKSLRSCNPWRSAYYLRQCGQLQARKPHVARHSVFRGPRNDSGKIFKSFVSLNWLHLSYRIACAR